MHARACLCASRLRLDDYLGVLATNFDESSISIHSDSDSANLRLQIESRRKFIATFSCSSAVRDSAGLPALSDAVAAAYPATEFGSTIGSAQSVAQVMVQLVVEMAPMISERLLADSSELHLSRKLMQTQAVRRA